MPNFPKKNQLYDVLLSSKIVILSIQSRNRHLFSIARERASSADLISPPCKREHANGLSLSPLPVITIKDLLGIIMFLLFYKSLWDGENKYNCSPYNIGGKEADTKPKYGIGKIKHPS
jgi:hypothetical protein